MSAEDKAIEDKKFLEILNNMLELMSNMSEGDYLKGANMCMIMKNLVNDMKTNIVYINMTKEIRRKGITHIEKLAKGNHHICKDCGIVISNDELKILKHKRCITHLRRIHQDRLLKKGLSYENVNYFITLKHKGIVNQSKYKNLYEFTLEHIKTVKENNN